MGTVAARLTQAIGERGRSIRSFQQALKKAGVRGSSYANVYAIMKGDTEAPLTFIEAAAKELDFPVAWLAFGRERGGHPTPEAEADEQAKDEIGELSEETMMSDEALMAEAWRGHSERTQRAIDNKLAFLEGMGVISEDLDSSRLTMSQIFNLHRAPYWLAALEEVRRRYRYQRGPGGGIVLEAGHSVDFGAVGRALRALLDALAIDPAQGIDSGYWTEAWLNEYIATAATAMVSLAPEHQRQQEARRAEA